MFPLQFQGVQEKKPAIFSIPVIGDNGDFYRNMELRSFRPNELGILLILILEFLKSVNLCKVNDNKKIVINKTEKSATVLRHCTSPKPNLAPL